MKIIFYIFGMIILFYSSCLSLVERRFVHSEDSIRIDYRDQIDMELFPPGYIAEILTENYINPSDYEIVDSIFTTRNVKAAVLVHRILAINDVPLSSPYTFIEGTGRYKGRNWLISTAYLHRETFKWQKRYVHFSNQQEVPYARVELDPNAEYWGLDRSGIKETYLGNSSHLKIDYFYLQRDNNFIYYLLKLGFGVNRSSINGSLIIF